jgi:hypothetical protein
MFIVHGLMLTGVAVALDTPIEPLHALDYGLITNCVCILFEEEMTPKQKRMLNILVWHLTNLPALPWLVPSL